VSDHFVGLPERTIQLAHHRLGLRPEEIIAKVKLLYTLNRRFLLHVATGDFLWQQSVERILRNLLPREF
jgi:hypothetical protein